jgi:hypothetical protein
MNLFSRTMVVLYCAGISSVSLVSCKAKANAIPTTVIAEPVDYMKATKILPSYNNKVIIRPYILEQMLNMQMTNKLKMLQLKLR